MGYAIAEAAIQAGHDVVLISGPVALNRPHRAAVIAISTSDQMFEAVQRQVRNCDVLVMCAAVADYKPASISKDKIKKRQAVLSLELVPTRDILTSLAKDRQFVLVGFAAETENIEANALKKLHEKNCDIIVANDARLAMEIMWRSPSLLFSHPRPSVLVAWGTSIILRAAEPRRAR